MKTIFLGLLGQQPTTPGTLSGNHTDFILSIDGKPYTTDPTMFQRRSIKRRRRDEIVEGLKRRFRKVRTSIIEEGSWYNVEAVAVKTGEETFVEAGAEEKELGRLDDDEIVCRMELLRQELESKRGELFNRVAKRGRWDWSVPVIVFEDREYGIEKPKGVNELCALPAEIRWKVYMECEINAIGRLARVCRTIHDEITIREDVPIERRLRLLTRAVFNERGEVISRLKGLREMRDREVEILVNRVEDDESIDSLNLVLELSSRSQSRRLHGRRILRVIERGEIAESPMEYFDTM
ncbi:hypothetical protein Q9L58_007821 [Maublancomyces gigas]|uniref:F-box domain-containing protein n=1 Tax=Discina gigas TaxID=1032678 RepID=A0ABR3GBE0_9PEZI